MDRHTLSATLETLNVVIAQTDDQLSSLAIQQERILEDIERVKKIKRRFDWQQKAIRSQLWLDDNRRDRPVGVGEIEGLTTEKIDGISIEHIDGRYLERLISVDENETLHFIIEHSCPYYKRATKFSKSVTLDSPDYVGYMTRHADSIKEFKRSKVEGGHNEPVYRSKLPSIS